MLGEMKSLWTPLSEEMGDNRVRQWAGSGCCMNKVRFMSTLFTPEQRNAE